MAPEDATDMLVPVRWQVRTMAVPLSQLAGVNVDQPPKPSMTGTIGQCRATVSNLCMLDKSSQSLVKKRT